MAYFSNGSEVMVFDDECAGCLLGDVPCPIAFVQGHYNYDACNNKIARAILDALVKDNGECTMKRTFPQHFKVDARQIEMGLGEECREYSNFVEDK
jgi:hypothetical protein